MLQKILFITLLSTLSVGALCACPKYKKIHAMLELESKALKEIEFAKNGEELCGTLPTPINANLKIALVKNNQKFETKIFRSLEGYWDQKGKKDKTWAGGSHALSEIEITSFIPDWFKGATLTITDMNSNTVLSETKLK